MHTPIKRFLTMLMLIPLLAGIALAQDYIEDDDVDDPDARVARIRVLVGDASIKRIDGDDWETVVENLPIVQGDTIRTERNSKIEIQLDRFSYLHLDGNTILKLVYLADDGIAMSLSQGTLGVRLVQFDFDKGYLEVDAPSSTVTVQKNGSYRIDAGDEFNREVRISVRDEGQARVYSQDSGFVVKDGRTARLFLDGNLAGQWETSRASTLFDGFDSWLQSRNESIARSLAGDDDSDYYDDDVYGADDLDDYGRWSYTSAYGYIWQPYRSSTALYADWTPYRYGHWRWLPYYGWTWVNDEPWGWATYHSGRWIFYRGNWYWSPHRRYRNTGRSWWRPALVFVASIGNNYCWYPLPYGYGYYDYNRRFRKRWRPHRRTDRRDRDRPVDRDQTPTRRDPDRKRKLAKAKPPLGRVPARGVVSVPASSFGRAKSGFGRPSLNVANEVLGRNPVLTNSTPQLPDYRDLKGRLDRDIKAPERKTRDFNPDTGASKRISANPLDEKLRREKIYRNRTPVVRDSKQNPRGQTKTPRTGAVERKRDSKGSPPILPRERSTEKPTYTPGRRSEDRKVETPRKSTRTPPYVSRDRQPDRKTRPEPRRNSPPIRSTPPARSTPKRSEPRRSPPVRSAPKKSAPKKSSPKPSKETPRKVKPGNDLT